MVKRLELTDDLFVRHGKTLEKMLQAVTREVLLDHKRAGNPIAVSENGRVVIIPPEEIEVDEVSAVEDEA
jgi:hypothetical protein